MSSSTISMSSMVSQLPPRSVEMDQIVSKKRKRCLSPRHGCRSRSQSPNGRSNVNEMSTKQRLLEFSSAVKVKIVSPTLRGVTESAKILRCGIFSFPTETMYSLVSFVPFKRRILDQLHSGESRQWESRKYYSHQSLYLVYIFVCIIFTHLFAFYESN